MATIITKNSSTASSVPLAAQLVQGELAVNVADKRLFTEDSGGTVVELGTNPSTLTVASGATIQGLTVGRGAGSVATNTAVGASALVNNTTGGQGVSVGSGAGSAITTGFNNVAIGFRSLYSGATTGGQNVGVGSYALYGVTTGANNSGFGQETLQSNTTGSSNVAVGTNALNSNTTSDNNTAVGYQAAYSNTTGTSLVAVGRMAMKSNTTGGDNSALGINALYSNTTGGSNTSIGASALFSNTTASNNTAVGYQAGYSNTTTGFSVYVGRKAGFASTGEANTLVGDSSGTAVTTGTYNAFLGQYSGALVTTGGKNTIIGSYSGNQGGLDIRTASNYIVLSDGDGNPRARWNNNYWLFQSLNNGNRELVWDGNGLYTTTDNTCSLGYSTSFRWSVVYAANGTIQTSDRNLKTNIEDLSETEKRVAVKLKGLIKKFKYIDAVEKKGNDARTHVGIIAQELEDAFASEGLDASKYGMFCFDDAYTVDGEARDKDGKFFTKDAPNAVMKRVYAVRYDQLLAFIISII